MTCITRLVLDVLKPHSPSLIEFGRTLAEQGSDYTVSVRVEEMDAKTESVVVVIEGRDIDFQAVTDAVAGLGGSVHSIDEVSVRGGDDGGH